MNGSDKIFANIIKKRIEIGVEDKLNKTQYGFRKQRGTAEAFQYQYWCCWIGKKHSISCTKTEFSGQWKGWVSRKS